MSCVSVAQLEMQRMDESPEAEILPPLVVEFTFVVRYHAAVVPRHFA